METSQNDILSKICKNRQESLSFVLATVVVGAEKTPGRSGFKLISYPNGNFEGTVGGGKLERLVLENCSRLHREKKNDFREYDLSEKPEGIGMQCGGTAKVFFEYFGVERRFHIFGAGHLCRALLPILKSLGFYLVVYDNRAEFLSSDSVPEASERCHVDYLDFLTNFQPDASDGVLIFTHGHEYDFDILDRICSRNIQLRYIGMIGSAEKVGAAVSMIRQASYPGNLIERIYAPVGLNIGKTTVQEIAIAISAEVLAVYNDIPEIRSLRDIRLESEEL
ncbi:MAG: XdhC family protein, partial [Candidatus Cloacimonetes bacterium]|nr:XdhC family protein [Candidatus Cloacimonadota bacterium]